MLHIYKLINL